MLTVFYPTDTLPKLKVHMAFILLFNVNNRNTSGVVLVSLLLTLNIFHTLF